MTYPKQAMCVMPLIAILAFSLSNAQFIQSAEGPLSPTNLRCEYLSNPLGIDVREPRFSWVLNHSDRGQMQTAYQILVSTRQDLLERNQADQWDSGKVVSSDSSQVAYHGKPLESGRTHYWKVRYWDTQDKVSTYSPAASFEMALLTREEWKGRWISGGNELRKEFHLDGKVVRARVYVTALGYYELRINGEKIGDHVLDPGWTTYQKRMLYVTYDITRQLRSGANAVGVMLGGGWATMTSVRLPKAPYQKPTLLLQMNIELENGKQISVVSDESWKATAAPVTSDSIFDGEVYDARLETPGWDLPGFDDASWKNVQAVEGSQGVLSAQMMPPIRVTDTIVPVRLTNPQPGVYVYDMGQNFAGWVRLRVSGPRGTEVKLRFAELIYEDGTINQENLFGAKARDIYVLKGQGIETWEPRFTYHGFRYVEVTGLPSAPNMDTVRGRVVHSAVGETGSFVASKQILNDIQRLIRWSELNNLQSVPTDCAQRDERMGWLCDLQVTAEEAMPNFDMAALYTNFVRNIQDVQGPDGSITDTVPEKWGSRPADPACGTAYPQLCWYMFQQYGDRRILEENYEGLRKYIQSLQSRAPDNVLRTSSYGDWVAIDPAPAALTSDAYYYFDVMIMQRVAHVLGKTADVEAYAQLASKIKEAFDREFYDSKTGNFGNGTQTANALAALLATPDQLPRLTTNLLYDIIYKHNTHLTVGYLGGRTVMPLLTRSGHADLAYDLAIQTTYPSWGFMLARGATTLWELWQERTGPEMNSHDHKMLGGSIGAWYYQALAGINPDEDSEGYRRLRVAPQIVEDLHWVSGSIETIKGTISSAWTHSPGVITLDVSIPVNTEAKIIIPKKSNMSEITIKEGDRVVWEKGQFVPGTPGITRGTQGDRDLTFEVGSGKYSFELTGK